MVSQGETHGCGIDTSGSLQCWGEFSGIGNVPSGEFVRVAAGNQKTTRHLRLCLHTCNTTHCIWNTFAVWRRTATSTRLCTTGAVVPGPPNPYIYKTCEQSTFSLQGLKTAQHCPKTDPKLPRGPEDSLKRFSRGSKPLRCLKGFLTKKTNFRLPTNPMNI